MNDDLTPTPVTWQPYLPGWLDFSGWIERWLPQPGPVLKPEKGKPVPAPGNPASKGGSQVSGIAGQIQEGLSIFIPTPSQKRDFAVYGLAVAIFLVAVFAIVK